MPTGIYIRTDEHLRKMSEANEGAKNPFYGKKHTEESRRKITEGLKGKMAGEKNPRWKGGISEWYQENKTERQWEKIRERILTRDNHICQDCGISGVAIDVHHVIPRKVSCDDSEKNLLALCKSCHRKADIQFKQSHISVESE